MEATTTSFPSPVESPSPEKNEKGRKMLFLTQKKYFSLLMKMCVKCYAYLYLLFLKGTGFVVNIQATTSFTNFIGKLPEWPNCSSPRFSMIPQKEMCIQR